MYTTLIAVSALADHLADPAFVVVDCRFRLADPGWGAAEYRRSHIPGARYAHLNEDLSAPHVQGHTGRHPLPPVGKLAATFGRWGITGERQVVAYDDAGGALAASRLWWLLRWLGHDAVAVLDGGWSAWLDAGLPVRGGVEAGEPREFHPHLRPERIVDAAVVAVLAKDPATRLLDARSADRYRGENETIDPRAGHIPGAVSAPFAENLDASGHMLPARALREHYVALLGTTPAGRAAVYCGSGVTAAMTILAMVHAGLDEPRLYAGSWSEWITDPDRAVATGPGDPPRHEP